MTAALPLDEPTLAQELATDAGVVAAVPVTVDAGQLTERQASLLKSYDDPAMMADIFESSGYEPGDDIRTLIRFARQNENTSLKMRATLELRRLRMNILQMHGLVGTAVQTQRNEDGSTTKLTTSVVARALAKARPVAHTPIRKETNESQQKPQEETVPTGSESADAGAIEARAPAITGGCAVHRIPSVAGAGLARLAAEATLSTPDAGDRSRSDNKPL